MKQIITFLICTVLSLPALAQPADTSSLFFALDDPFLDAKAEKQLDKIFKGIGSQTRIVVIGYADYLGDQYYNDMLSMRRAQNVANYLERKGMDKANIRLVMGKGEVYREKERHGGYRKDRRVDVVVKNKLAPQKPVPAPKPVPVVKKQDTVIKKEAAVVTKESVAEVKEGETLKLDKLYFIGGQHLIRKGSEQSLEELYQIMKDNPKLKIQIEGHVCCTNYDDDDGYDYGTGRQDLSVARAKFVYDYLIDRGIFASRLSYKGFARTKPVTRDESTELNADMNRRVEIRILEK